MMKSIIEFLKDYSLQDFIKDLMFFGGAGLFVFGSWFCYVMLYYIFKG